VGVIRRHKVCGYNLRLHSILYFNLAAGFDFLSLYESEEQLKTSNYYLIVLSNNKRHIIEKKHRLPPELYVGKKFVAFTGNVKNRAPLFSNKKTFYKIEEILLEALSTHDCDACVYLFMPDHFHFILSGKNSKSNIKKCIDSFKQKSGYWLYKNLPEFKWQKDYYDHIIRSDEDLFAQIHYILNNPVKAGLVNYWKKYKMRGSTIYNLDEWR